MNLAVEVLWADANVKTSGPGIDLGKVRSILETIARYQAQ